MQLDKNSFNIQAEDLPDEMAYISKLQKQLIETHNDETLCHDFKMQKESLSSFWVKVY